MNEHNILMPREDMRLPNGYGTVKKPKGRRRYSYVSLYHIESIFLKMKRVELNTSV